jgi:hypothetical protein
MASCSIITPPTIIPILTPLGDRCGAAGAVAVARRRAAGGGQASAHTHIPHFYHVPHFGVARRRLRRSAKISLTSQTVRPPARVPLR